MPAAVPGLMTMLQSLIASPSVSSTSPDHDMGNLGVIQLLAEWLNTLGFKTEVLPLSNNPQKANLIATLGSGPGGLVLSGHTDTVPFNAKRWEVDPLKLTKQDNRLYGLGATDMKGFFPIAIEAAKAFLDQPLQQPLIILATADEESSMEGARQLAEMGRPKARAAIIGEPTGLKPIRAHKGVMMEAVTVVGRAGHSSNPSLGNSALEAMQEVMTELIGFRNEMQAKYTDPQFEINIPTLNLGCIHGGDNPNRICGQCELHFDLRALPGMDNQELREEISQRIQPVAERRSINISLRSLMPGVAPFHEAPDSELTRVTEKLSGYAAETVAFGTEGPFMQQLGMQTIVMGPGSIDQAHQPDEFLSMDQLKPAVALYEQLIAHYCL